MDWQAVLVLAVIFFFLSLVFLRTEKRARRLILLLITLPILVLIARWSSYRQSWNITAIAAGIALAGILIWWFTLGRRLPAAEPRIKVWDKDEPFE